MRLEWNIEEAQIVSGLVGIPWSDLGDTEAGAYCTGLACLFFRHHGIDVPNPCSESADVVLNSAIHQRFVPVGLDSPRYGDVAAIEVAGEAGMHVGIWTPEGVLHATRKAGSIVTPARRLKILGYYRHHDLN